MDDFYDHEPVTDEELAEMPEDQRFRASLIRQLMEEARSARDAFEAANTAYANTWDVAPARTAEDAERALADLLEVGRLYEAYQTAEKETFALLRFGDDVPRES